MVKHNNVIPNGHFKKHWQNYVKTWFNQPARKQRRRIGELITSPLRFNLHFVTIWVCNLCLSLSFFFAVVRTESKSYQGPVLCVQSLRSADDKIGFRCSSEVEA